MKSRLLLLAIVAIAALFFIPSRNNWRPPSAANNPAPRPRPPDATAMRTAADSSQPPAPSAVTRREAAPSIPTAPTLGRERPVLPAFDLFSEWAQRYQAAPTPDLVAEGVRLATRRRVELAKLIRADPQLALELAAPGALRRALPAEVAALLEEPVRGRGDLTLMAAMPEPGQPLTRPANSRFATIGDKTYNAFVYGRRLGHPTRWNIPLHGIAIDGNAAFAESPARVLEAAEAAAAKAAQPSDPICSISGLASTANNEEIALDVGEEIKFLCNAEHAARLAASLAAAEDALPPGAGAAAKGGPAEYAHTGNRKILLIRVDFSDYTTDPFTDTEGTNIIVRLAVAFSNWSCGRMTVPLVGEGSDYTPVYRMPMSNAEYNGDDGQLRTDARAAATADGYDLNAYDLDAVCFGGGASGWGYGGLAYVGARGAWLHTTGESSTANIGSHEFGHNFGLNHANFYAAPFGTVIATGGANDEYGNPWDSMGSASTANAFGASQKKYLGWVTNGVDGNEWVAVSSGTTTNRLYAHDENQEPGFLKGIRVTRDTSLNNDKEYYWLEYRTTKSNKALDNGVVVNWAGNGNEKPELLDTTPNSDPDSGNDKDDSPLVIGRTFTDPDYNIHITPIGKGSGPPSWIDVVVRYGPFPGNIVPTVSVSAPDTNASTGVSLSFTATADDADGDTLAYSWDYGDGDYSTSNSPNVSHSWSSAGEYRVQCTVSDMKGGVARKSVIVRIGSPTVFTISGQALLHGVPQTGVRVYTDATNFTYSDSDGIYQLVGLKAGSYSVSAFQESHSFIRGNFANPIVVGPGTNNLNFAGGIPLAGGFVTRTMNMGATNTPMVFWVFDWETAHTNLTLDFVSGNTNIIPDSGFTFSTSGTNRLLTLRPAATGFGTVTNLLLTTDADGATLTNTFTLNVQPPPALTTATNTGSEDVVLTVDLWARTSDANPSGTSDSNILFTVTGMTNGTVTLLTNRTVRFAPTTNYNGPASFAFTALDKGFHPSLLLYYDFEPTDTTSDSASSDRSGNVRTGTLDADGTGAFAYVTNDAPPSLAPFSLVSLLLTENGASNSARLYRRMLTSEYNLNNADWTFACWFRRDATTNDDYLFYDGPVDGGGSGDEELQLYLPSGSGNRVRVRLYNVTNGIDMEINGPTTALTGEWHHVALTYDRTNSNRGNFRLYFNGALAGSSNGVTINIAQTNLIFGGHNGTNSTDRWFNGSLDEVALFKTALSSNDILFLQDHTVAHFGGLSTTTNIALNFNPVNDAPTLTPVSNVAFFATNSLVVTNLAADVDGAGQTHTFSLATAPTGAVINAGSGVVTWLPGPTEQAITNEFRVVVTDNGVPALSATNTFTAVARYGTGIRLDPALAQSSKSGMKLELTGLTGSHYFIEVSDDLQSWAALTTVAVTNNAVQFTDRQATNFSQRFYRAVLVE